MEATELRDLLKQCPLQIRMNDGREYFVEKPEFILVGDYTAGLLVDDAGVKRNAVITLVNITAVLTEAPVNGAGQQDEG